MNWKIGTGFKYGMNWKAMSRIPLETGHLLNRGDTLQVHNDITGGWEGYGGPSRTLQVAIYTNPTTWSPSWMYTIASGGQSADIITANKVDLADVKQITFTVYIWGGQGGIEFGVRGTKMGLWDRFSNVFVYGDVETTVTINVEDLVGDYYIGLYYTNGHSVRLYGVYITT